MLKTLWFAFCIVSIRFWRWFKPVAFVLVAVWLFISTYMGGKFDEICVEGRLSAEQARVLSEMEWGHCPSYRNGNCVAEANDRVFVGQCSEFTKFLWRPDKWGRALRTGELPWQY